MPEWSSEQYLKFKNQRTQPAIDLAKRIADKNPHTVLDIGCGPGNSTTVLKTRGSHCRNRQFAGDDRKSASIMRGYRI